MWNKYGIAIPAMAAALAIATPAMGQLLTIGDVDLKVDVLTTRVEGIVSKQNAAETERAALLADIGRIDVDLSVLRSDTTDNTAAIAINTSLLSDHDTRLTALDGTVVTLQTDVTQLSGVVSGIGTRLDAQIAQADTNTSAIATLATDLDGLSARVDANGALLSDQDTRLAGLEEALAGSLGDIADIDAGLTGLSGRVDDLTGALAVQTSQTETNTAAIATINSDLDGLSARFDANGALLSQHDSRLADLEGGLAGSLGDLTEIDAGLTGLSGRVDDLTGALAVQASQTETNTAAIATVEVDLGVLNARVDGHDTALVGLGARVGDHDTALAGLDARVGGLEAAVTQSGTLLASIENRVTRNSSAVETLRGDVDANVQAIAANTATNLQQDVAIAANAATNLAQDIAIATNAIRIDTNAAAISVHETRIASNETNIAANTAANLKQDAQLQDHSARIAANTSGLADAVAVNDLQTAAIVANSQANAALRADVAEGRIGMVRAAADGTVLVASDRGGTTVSFEGTEGARRLSGIANGIAASDAATMGQMVGGDIATLQGAQAYTDRSIAAVMDDLDRMWANLDGTREELGREIDRASAGTAALAGLPQAIMPGKGMVVAGVGGRREQAAIALGIGKAFDSPTMPVVRAGVAVDLGDGTASYNAAVGIHF